MPIKHKFGLLPTIIGGGAVGLFWVVFASVMVMGLVVTFPIVTLLWGRRTWQKMALNWADWYWGCMVKFNEGYGKCQFVISGDDIPPRETVVIMVNHRWYLDWLMLFSLAARKGRLGCAKIFCKDSIKWIPGMGWGCYLLDFIFLKRNWNRDWKNIQATFHNLHTRGFPFWVISHLEGTRMSPKKLQQSQEYAKKNDLPVLTNVLLPRTKGITSTVNALRENDQISAVYDVTIMYEDGVAQPQLTKIALRTGMKVHLHVRRYPIDQVPKDENALSDWVIQRWKEKDQLIEHFKTHGNFPDVRKDPFVHLPMQLK